MSHISDADKRILHAVSETWKAQTSFPNISQTFFREAHAHGLIEKKTIESTVLWRLTGAGKEARRKAGRSSCKGRIEPENHSHKKHKAISER